MQNFFFHLQRWDHKQGWHIYGNRERLLPVSIALSTLLHLETTSVSLLQGDPDYPNFTVKSGGDFADRGFKERSAFKEL